MKDTRTRTQRLVEWFVRWTVVVMIVIQLPIWFLATPEYLNKNHDWNLHERFQNGSFAITVFIAGWLWHKWYLYRQYNNYIERVVKDADEFYAARATREAKKNVN